MPIALTFTILFLLAAPALAAEGTSGVFDGTLAQSIAAIVVFLVLFGLLYKMAWGPILKGLQDREGKIKGDLERAEAAARQAAQTLTEYQQNLSQAQVEAQRIVEQSRSDAQRVAAELRQEAEAEIRQIKQRATAEIRTAKEEALADIYAQAAVLSTDIAGRILQREIRPEDQQRLVQESLAALGKAQRN